VAGNARRLRELRAGAVRLSDASCERSRVEGLLFGRPEPPAIQTA